MTTNSYALTQKGKLYVEGLCINLSELAKKSNQDISYTTLRTFASGSPISKPSLTLILTLPPLQHLQENMHYINIGKSGYQDGFDIKG